MESCSNGSVVTSQNNNNSRAGNAVLIEISDVDGELFEIFRRFESFNFDEDENFQAGLSKIASSANPTHTAGLGRDLEKMRAFYYSRNIEFFNYTAYVRWKQSKGKQLSDRSLQDEAGTSSRNPAGRTSERVSSVGSVSPSMTKGSAGSGAEGNISSQDKSSSQSGPGLDCKAEHCVVTEDSSNKAEELSFTELVEFLQGGKPIPGLVEVDVVASDLPPTPSSLPRAKKPWEE